MKFRRWIVPLAVLLAASTAIAAASAGGNRTHATHARQLKIALSNSFIGNTWRLEMENTFKAACKMQPFKSQVSCSVYNSGNDVSKETQQISNLISQHVDAIVIDAASPTGLNGIVGQACARGIIVISFDNIVTNKCGLTVNTDQVKFGQLGGQFLADQLHGKGNVVMVTGVAGTSVDTDRNNGVESVIKKYPNMKIVAHFSGMWDSSTAQRVTAAQLPSLPQVDGVWVSGGTDGVVKAFIDANKPVPVVAGEGENGYRRYLLPGGYNGHHVTGISIGQPPFLSVAALELAREILLHKHAKKSILLPFPVVTNATVKSGITVFPNLPDSFFADFTDSGPKATVKLCVQAALKGTACPGPLNVRLP
jgi:ribose transport system substrate-binding protein